MSMSFQWTEGLFCDFTWLVLTPRYRHPSLSTTLVKRWLELGATPPSLLLALEDLVFLWNPVFNVDLKLCSLCGWTSAFCCYRKAPRHLSLAVTPFLSPPRVTIRDPPSYRGRVDLQPCLVGFCFLASLTVYAHTTVIPLDLLRLMAFLVLCIYSLRWSFS